MGGVVGWLGRGWGEWSENRLAVMRMLLDVWRSSGLRGGEGVWVSEWDDGRSMEELSMLRTVVALWKAFFVSVGRRTTRLALQLLDSGVL